MPIQKLGLALHNNTNTRKHRRIIWRDFFIVVTFNSKENDSPRQRWRHRQGWWGLEESCCGRQRFDAQSSEYIVLVCTFEDARALHRPLARRVDEIQRMPSLLQPRNPCRRWSSHVVGLRERQRHVQAPWLCCLVHSGYRMSGALKTFASCIRPPDIHFSRLTNFSRC